MTRHGSYRAFKASLANISSKSQKHFFIYGNCDFLANRALAEIKKKLSEEGKIESYSLEHSDINDEFLSSSILQQSLFEPRILYVIRRAQQSKNLAKLINIINKSEISNKALALQYNKDEISKDLNENLTSSRFLRIPCLTPWPNELLLVTSEFANNLRVNLSKEAIQFILDKTGDNLSLLSNELEKLSLILRPKAGAYTKSDIMPYLDTIREDDIFTLINFLLKGDLSKAHTLVEALLTRGVAPTNIVGLITRHLRNFIQVKDGASSAQTRLPRSIHEDYVHADSLTPHAAARAIETCSKVERILKSEPISDDLLLTYVIESFRWH